MADSLNVRNAFLKASRRRTGLSTEALAQRARLPDAQSAGVHQRRILEIALGELETGLAHHFLIGRVGRRRGHVQNGVVAVSRRHHVLVPHEPGRVLAGAHRADAAPHLVAEHADAAVGLAKVFEAVDRDRPLRYLRLVVARVALTFLVTASGDLPRHHLVAVDPPRRVLFALAEMTQLDEHRAGVIHWHQPARHHRTAERVDTATVLGQRRDLLQVRQDALDHAGPDILADPP